MATRLIDYSAGTRMVAGDPPDMDTALLPARLAWDLLQPLVINELMANRSVKHRNQALRL
jgi:hypothetical protein